MDLTRAGGCPQRDPPPLHQLPTKQRMIVEAIEAFERVTGEACPASYLSRRLHVHHSTIQDHLSALHRKGWLRTPHAPARLIDRRR